jgi:hypothetical protein
MKFLNTVIFSSILSVACFPSFAWNRYHEPNNWLCKVSPFTSEYSALGRSKAEATYNVQRKCTADHNAMFCKDVSCEGPETPFEEDYHNPGGIRNRGWICRLEPFTKRYESIGLTRAEAKIKVMEQCRREQNEMFCVDPKCEEG